MRRLHIQFHADPVELVSDLLPAWLDGMQFYAAAEAAGSDRWELPMNALPSVADAHRSMLVLTIHRRPLLHVDYPRVKFLRENPDFLSVTPGQFTPNGLRESVLGSMVQDEGTASVWRTVIARAKQGLLRGGVVVNARGEEFGAPNHLYSAKALELEQSGTPMLAVAGTVRFRLGATLRH